MSLYLLGLLVILGRFWCPEEDVEISLFIFSYSNLFLFKNIKAVLKAVPTNVSGQNDDLRHAPKALWVVWSASGPNRTNRQRTAAASLMSPMLQCVRMAAITREAKPFNNCLGFERGLWQRRTGTFQEVPKRRVFGTCVKWRLCKHS
jgi:hypothetical protein